MLAPATDLHLANDVSQSFAAHIFAFNRFVGHSIGDDEEDFRQIGVFWSEDDEIVALKKTKPIRFSNHSSAARVQFAKRHVKWHNMVTETTLPFDEIAQKVKCVNSFFFVLIEGQPAEPVGKD